uniref:Rieske n=1 Tax=Tetraselmis sp. GSL018 TaxID=582737 RepID=A0A061QX41_9CHLO|mmetsp:Transcript_8132/g.19479  ORF Transcript_8132/g.19479 Transcript_8132/m.19479 type:complete len:305 (-) Transcript_8132:62-976(-)|eukprot:CAMPEP_0177613064 /NCGR_PEP_ID=MMETSP0419_2-20121207/21704_1 /TAXON_ID=582737 /ORGANISM="Tetraselmis sp., Strain GSL018" /LENGTH=304 /DNA_ID=CAMNT_0019109593 /DNA_START=60 /DNA_END=974 /DNA_ORIENTATION=+
MTSFVTTSCYAKSAFAARPARVFSRGGVSSKVVSASQRVPTLSFNKRGTWSQRRRHAIADAKTTESESELGAAPDEDLTKWVPVFPPEELPKGVRKEVVVDGLNVLLFWYRNEIFAIEARSPSEGAYSEGFMQSKFTQNYGIECPATGSVFSLKTGEILDWYPNNPALRMLTPSFTCRPMEVYPVKLTQDAIMVDVANGSLGGVSRVRTKGGSDTSLENNNVFGVEPAVYLEGTDPSQPLSVERSKTDVNPVTALIALLAVAIISVAGTALLVVNENFIGLGLFWAVGFGIVGGLAYNYTKDQS